MKWTLFIKAVVVFQFSISMGKIQTSNIKKIRLIRFHTKPAKGNRNGLLIIYKDSSANLAHFFPVFA